MVISFKHTPRRWRFALLVAQAGAIGFTGASQANERAGTTTGPMRVIDGDSFEVAGVKIRLHAVDAPETDQMCETRQGAEWACGGWISKVVTDRYNWITASCERLDTDRYGRTVARCTALGGDIGAWLVSEGFAFAYVKYGSDYVALEREAAAADRGLHAVRMQSPEQHRRNGRAEPQRVSGECNIKGNISAKGVKIYHMSGQEFYNRTRISLSKGERWFCSEAAARAAGWRKARR
jgi:endonuclease YncB( thermonuclease family)